MRSMNVVAMRNPLLILASRRDRPRRIASAERSAKQGRAWINGREVGGTEARFAHLSSGSD